MSSDMKHPQQKKALKRKDALEKLVKAHPGHTKKELAAICYINNGWFPRTTIEQLEILVQFGILKSVKLEEEERIYPHDYDLTDESRKEDQLTLTDLSTIADKMPVQRGGVS